MRALKTREDLTNYDKVILTLLGLVLIGGCSLMVIGFTTAIKYLFS